MTELGRESIRCSGRVTSKRRSEYEVRYGVFGISETRYENCK